MVRYPHTITVSWKGEPVKNEADGTYTVGLPETHQVECLVSQNTSGRKIGSPDGQMIEYASSVIMAKQTWKAPVGANVIVSYPDTTTYETSLKGMLNRRTHSVIWL